MTKPLASIEIIMSNEGVPLVGFVAQPEFEAMDPIDRIVLLAAAAKTAMLAAATMADECDDDDLEDEVDEAIEGVTVVPYKQRLDG